MVRAMQARQSVLLNSNQEPVLAVPVRVRDEVVGALSFRKGGDDATWSADEVELLEELTDQLGVALESARLYQDTQRRAARERLSGEVAARVRETLDIDNVLQTAVREMRGILNLEEVEIRIGSGQAAAGEG